MNVYDLTPNQISHLHDVTKGYNQNRIFRCWQIEDGSGTLYIQVYNVQYRITRNGGISHTGDPSLTRAEWVPPSYRVESKTNQAATRQEAMIESVKRDLKNLALDDERIWEKLEELEERLDESKPNEEEEEPKPKFCLTRVLCHDPKCNMIAVGFMTYLNGGGQFLCPKHYAEAVKYPHSYRTDIWHPISS